MRRLAAYRDCTAARPWLTESPLVSQTPPSLQSDFFAGKIEASNPMLTGFRIKISAFARYPLSQNLQKPASRAGIANHSLTSR